MRFDSPGKLTEVLWNMRLADLSRAEDRAVLQRLFNGNPPYDEREAEENQNQVNRNFLEGPNLLAQARRQWNQAFLSSDKYFTIAVDRGPKHKRTEWSRTLTRVANRPLRRSRKQTDLIRSIGANAMLYGIGPANWPNRRSIVPTAIPLSSLLVPSETDIDFENLEWFGIFREYTPAQLYEVTHGLRVDRGWNLPLVERQLKLMAEKYQKEPSATAYQYMPERIVELIKQDKGFWNTDAVPTIDVWDFYFREADDGEGWYRRMVLDWGDTSNTFPKDINPDDPKDSEHNGFLYTGGQRKYADSLSQILHCQFGDCSCLAPFKYHSVRSLGWMLWGVCDLQNRLRCRFTESLFEQLMWFFRANEKTTFDRVKKAMFTHLGVIPSSVQFIPAQERFKPDPNYLQLGFLMNRQLMAENSAAFTQKLDPEEKEMTATETMARVNSVNAMVSGMLNLAYVYQESFYREQCRRLCLEQDLNEEHNDPMAARFRKEALKAGVESYALDVECWDIQPVRIVGGGDKTLQMAAVQFLNSVRPHMGPQGQRIIDNLAVFAVTDQAHLAEEIAPLDDQKKVSNSVHDAQLSTERLMRGLPFADTADMVHQDYVETWLMDMGMIVQKIQQSGGMATPDQLAGLGNMAQHIQKFIAILEQDKESKHRIKPYADALGNLNNFVKAFAQRLQEQQQKQAQSQGGNGGMRPEDQAKIAGTLMLAKVKSDNLRTSHALRTAQKQSQWEAEEQRKDREHAAELQRENQTAALRSLIE